MRQKFTAAVSSLKEIRKFVQDKLTEKNINSKTIQDVILGVGEASMNIVKHCLLYTSPSPRDRG